MEFLNFDILLGPGRRPKVTLFVKSPETWEQVLRALNSSLEEARAELSSEEERELISAVQIRRDEYKIILKKAALEILGCLYWESGSRLPVVDLLFLREQLGLS